MSEPSKDTIYIDIDDEITTIIDKLRGSSHKVVALVLPKRASVLQSIVNMKLLKKTADQQKKRVVLITSEAGLLPLAGSVGLHVAKTLQTKPELPTPPEEFGGVDSVDEPIDIDSEPTDFDPKEVADKSVGELADKSEEPKDLPKRSKPLEPDETIELNEDELAAAGTIGESIAENKKNKKGKKGKKNNKLKVPDFLKIRRILIIGGLVLLLLIILLVILIKVLPKASVAIQTNNQNVNTNLTLNLSTSAKSLDATGLVVPATVQQVSKTNSQEVPATGQQNNGAQATGAVQMTACESTPQPPADVPQGTGISVNGLTFITQSDTTFSHNGFTTGNCFSYPSKNNTQVTAQAGGAKYNNISSNSWSVPGRNDVSASSATTTSGGTDSIISVVTQNDVNNATQKIAAQDTSSIKQSLEDELKQAGLDPIVSSFNAGTPSLNATPNVGTQANNVTVTQTVSYTMFGVHQSDLSTLVDNSVKQNINSSQQTILSDGVNNASFNVLSQTASQAQVTMQTTSTVGSQLNISTIQKQIEGKKSGDVQTIIKGYPGVQSVTVHFSPFWVSSVPANTSKIHITILKQSGS